MDKAKPARISSLLVFTAFFLVSCLSLWAQSPVVTGLNPGAGPVGSTITISGTNLGTSTGTVTFNGVTAAVTAWNAGQVTAVVPMSATTGSVVVTTSGGGAAAGVPFTVTGVTYAYDDLGRLVAVVDPLGNGASYAYDAVGNILSIQRYLATQVSVISFAPGQGVIGSTVIVSGTGFSSTAAQNAVTFNGVAASVTSSTPSQITVTVPASATSGPIAVTSPLGSATSAGTFTVKPNSGVPTITSVVPSVALAGASIALTGTNFDPAPANDRVAVNLTPVNPSAATATSLSFTVPAGATSGRIYLDAPGGMAINPPDLFIPFGVHTVADVGYTGRMTVGGSQAVTLSGGGKIGLLLFDGRISQRVNLQFSGDTFGADCRLYLFAPDGSSPFSNYCTGSSTILTLNASGSYLVGIEGGAAAGSVTVGVTDDSDVVTSIQIDGPAVSVTSAAGQDIRLVFNAIAGQRVVAQVSNLLAPTTLYFLGPITQQVLSNGATLFLDTQLLPASGTYTIRLTHTGAASGSALVTLISVPPDFTAPITIGGSAVRVPASGNTAIGQNGVLTFSGTAGQKVSASLSIGTYSSGGCQVTVKDPSGTAVASGYCDSGTFIDTITLAVTGAYTIFVNPLGAVTGTVTIGLNNDTDVTGSIAIDGSPVTATTTLPGQDARLTFSATAGQVVALQVTSVTTPGATVLLLKPDGTTQTSVGISASPSQIFFIDRQTLAAAGTYTLWVRHSGAGAGSETLQLTTVPSDFSGTITIGGAAVRIPATGNTAPGQNASLSFSGTAGQKVSINVSNGTYSPGTCNVYLNDPGGNALTSGQCGSGASPFIEPVTLASTGTYSLFVNPLGAATGTTTLSLNNDADVTAAIAIDGSPVTVNTTAPGQDARLTFTATTGQNIVITASSVTMGTSVALRLLNPSGTQQTSITLNSTPAQTFFIDRQTLATAAGTWTLWLLHSGASTGGATLQVQSVPADFTSAISIGGAAVRVPATGNNALGQNAVLTFNATAGQPLRILTSNDTFTPNISCLLTVRDAAGNAVTSAWVGAGMSTTIGPFTPGTTGVWSILLDPQGSYTGTITLNLVTP